MRQISLLLTFAVAALVFAPGCQKQTAEDQTKKAEENRAAAAIKNYEPLKDPVVRKALEADPAMADKYKNELDAAKLPGPEPVAPTPAAPESATSAAPATPAESAASATPAASAAPATN